MPTCHCCGAEEDPVDNCIREMYVEITAKWIIHRDCVEWMPHDREYHFCHIDDYLEMVDLESTG